MIRILLADDHPIVRAGLRALIAAESDMTVVAEAGTVAAAIEACRSIRVDVVLMDLQFGTDRAALQGVDATRVILQQPEAPRVLVLTNYDTDADILGAIEAGASGYLLKDAPPAELIAAVRATAAGQSALGPASLSAAALSSAALPPAALSPAVAERLTRRARTTEPGLSLREAEVLALVADGKTNREIGHTLFLSEATVKSHLVHIFTKLGVTSRTSAVARARETGAIRS